MEKKLCLGTIPFLLLAVALLLSVFCSIATFVALAVPLDHYSEIAAKSLPPPQNLYRHLKTFPCVSLRY